MHWITPAQTTPPLITGPFLQPGRWGKALSPKVEHIQGGEFDAILDSKIKEGYEPVENYDRLEGCGYVETIAQTLDENIEIY